MCDTLVIHRDGAMWMAKNSDREPDEPQVVEVFAAVRGDRGPRLRCTHIEIDQVPDRHGVLISRPSWMWGAEMGVNTAGVAIGNEAIFSRQVDRHGLGLLGMDLLRLGLERGASAAEASRVITELLERHGQGGPAGYRRKSFRYDNSFLIADSRQAFVLETCGRDWVQHQVSDAWAISNTYTIRGDVSARSPDAPAMGFGRRHETWLRPRLGRARDRVSLSRSQIAASTKAPMSLAVLAQALRSHAEGDGFTGGSNRDLCMHTGRSFSRPSHTTGSMVVKLAPGAPPRAAFTGTPSPCVSLFRPADFEGDFSVFEQGLWHQGEGLLARLGDEPEARERLRASIAEVEPGLLGQVEAGELATADASSREWSKAWGFGVGGA